MKLGMTKLAAIALSAAMFGGLSATSASALPYTSADRNLSSSNLIEDVQIRRGDRKYRNRGYRNRSHSSRRYRAGRRYSHAPRNWRRYNSRPSYWRSRGCIIVGPIWFCP
jgi:hypothetical protein